MLSVVVLALLVGGGVVALNLHPRNAADTAATTPSGTPDSAPDSAPDSGSDSASDSPSDSTPDGASDDPSDSASSGDYQQPPDCSQLNNGSITFEAAGPVTDDGYTLSETCAPTSGDAPAVDINIFTGPDGDGEAAADNHSLPISGTGLGSTPGWGYVEDACFGYYTRRNEYVVFHITGVDAHGCEDAATRYAERYYPLIG